MSRRTLGVVLFFCSLALPASALATEWVDVKTSALAGSGTSVVTADGDVQTVLVSATSGSAEIVAGAALADAASVLGLEEVELEPAGVVPVGQATTVRYTQVHDGVPVLGSAVAVHVSAEGQASRIALDVERGLTVSTTPDLDAAEARTRAKAGGLVSVDIASDADADLVVLKTGHGGTLAWSVLGTAEQGLFRVLVDAHTGDVVGQLDRHRHALGRVYGISSVSTPQLTDETLPQLDTLMPQTLTGFSGNLAVANYVSGSVQADLTVEQTLEPNSGEDFLYDPPAMPTTAMDEFAQVMTYYHLARMGVYFGTTHSLDMSASSWDVTAVANMMNDGQAFDNAFFSPEGLSDAGALDAPNLIGIGQGSVDFAHDSDVFMHEYTHYVTHNAVGYNQGQLYANEWGFSPYSGGIDEGISDYFANTVNGDPVTGEASLALLPQGNFSRDLSQKTKVCPDDVFGQVHQDGEIIGMYTWEVREILGAELADQLVWGGVSMLTPGATLGDMALAVEAIAADMVTSGDLTQMQLDQVVAAGESRGLDDCGHSIAISEDEPIRYTLAGMNVLGAAVGFNCATLQQFGFQLQAPFQLNATPPANAIGATLRVEQTKANTFEPDGVLQWQIYGRAGERITFANGMFGPSVQDFDYLRGPLAGENAEMVIDASSDPAFDPTQDLHFLVMQANCPTNRADVTIEWMLDETMPMDDPGMTDMADATSGDTSTGDATMDGDTGTSTESDATMADATTGEDTAPGTADTAIGGDTGTTPGMETGEEVANSDDGCSCTTVRTDEDAPAPLLPLAAGALGLGLVALRRRRR